MTDSFPEMFRKSWTLKVIGSLLFIYQSIEDFTVNNFHDFLPKIM